VIAVTSAPEEPSGRLDDVDIVDLEAEKPQGTLEAQAEFDEIVVWGHEMAVDAAADPYLRGAEEWLALAGKV
jgi:ribonuclease H2 subunit C